MIMIEGFKGVYSFDSDFFVGDYTEYLKTHSEFKDVKGVLITSKERDEISFLHFHNKNQVKVDCVNFEENPSFLKDEAGKTVKQCECFCVSQKDKGKAWFALVELKYCKAAKENIIRNFHAAIGQLEKSFIYLRDIKQLIEEKEYHYYWIVSMPEHTDQVPFTSFAMSQNEILDYKDKYHAIIIGDTDIEILNPGYIRGMN